MKQSGGITVYNSDLTAAATITVIFEDDGVDVEKIIDAEGTVLYEAEGGGENT